MKEFEKWLNKNHRHWKKFPCTTSTYKEGWRAALEFAIEEIIGCLSPQGAIEVLREELEGGD